MTDTPPSALLAPLFSSAAMRAVVDDRARLQRMLDFEAALARAEAAIGIIPASAASDIASACRAERYDIAALGEAAIPTGDIASAAVAALTAEVAKRSTQSADYVHWGASSQDVIDTALALELRDAIDTLVADLDRAIKAFTTLAGRHRRTTILARVMLRQTLPMTFGLKLAGYAAALARSRERLRRVRREALALQLGGTAGTLATLGEQGLEVSARVAALLDLPNPDAPWHSHRDRFAEVASVFAILAGSCGKIARDVALLMQSEVGEMPESPAAGHAASIALSAAAMAPGLVSTILATQIQEHELGTGQSEWATFSALMLTTSGALQAAVDIAEGLEVDVERMKANLEASGGLVFAEAVSLALTAKLGRAQAHSLTEELARKAAAEKRPLQQVLAADDRVRAQLDTAAIERLFMPMSYQNSAQNFIDRLVASTQFRHARRLVDTPPPATEPKPAAVVTDAAKPAAEPPPAATNTDPVPEPPADQPGALIEAFARVSDAADQLAAKPSSDRERKPA